MSATFGLCRDCAHWRGEDRYASTLWDGLKQCYAALELWEQKEYTDEGEERWKEGAENAKAFVQDGSDYHAKLLTRADFGCVQFEQRKPEPTT